jgi:hypothetical protein
MSAPSFRAFLADLPAEDVPSSFDMFSLPHNGDADQCLTVMRS